ncbi:hypothetical protein D3C73_911630 [compost metagenome]
MTIAVMMSSSDAPVSWATAKAVGITAAPGWPRAKRLPSSRSSAAAAELLAQAAPITELVTPVNQMETLPAPKIAGAVLRIATGPMSFMPATAAPSRSKIHLRAACRAGSAERFPWAAAI